VTMATRSFKCMAAGDCGRVRRGAQMVSPTVFGIWYLFTGCTTGLAEIAKVILIRPPEMVPG
jgi:hypothetical protein